jgi:hypothetical protein
MTCDCGGRLVPPYRTRLAVLAPRELVCVQCGTLAVPPPKPWRNELAREASCSCRIPPRIVYLVPLGYHCDGCGGRIDGKRLDALWPVSRARQRREDG